MKVDIVARSGDGWQGEASSVVVPAFEGELGILDGREPLLAVLRTGTVRVESGSGEKTFEVPQGFVVVDSNVVTIVVDDSGEGELHLEELDD
ncbi:MAG: F0F1 ATP synthase subunit epsilon [Flaviflexus sp.]|uniref:F0F1 ATP synthase subunit epsilon n=1 Tax=Flaviflexus sp. TaxID=1969482 RepID=UPI003F922BDD